MAAPGRKELPGSSRRVAFQPRGNPARTPIRRAAAARSQAPERFRRCSRHGSGRIGVRSAHPGLHEFGCRRDRPRSQRRDPERGGSSDSRLPARRRKACDRTTVRQAVGLPARGGPAARRSARRTQPAVASGIRMSSTATSGSSFSNRSGAATSARSASLCHRSTTTTPESVVPR